MRAANGSKIATYGKIKLPITSDGRRYQWSFQIADVCTPLLGADFLEHHDLLVDVKRRKIYPSPSQPAAAASTSDDYAELKKNFKDVFASTLRASKAPSKHHVRHFIKTTGPPVYARFRRLAPDRLAAVKECFRDMEAQGICQKDSSPWASPLHVVVKKDGSLRPCGDYRRLNNITEADHYPLPNISDVTTYLHGAAIFSKLDLMKGYFQVPMNPEDIPKTAIVTPFGTYTFNYSCFGMKNSGATFQRLMDDILGDLPFCVCYVDDVLIYSSNKQQHLQHLKIVLERLSNNGLIAREDKCIFGASEVEFLGHKINQQGVTPLQEKVQAVQHFPKPTTVKGLQEFLGLITFYHRFLPNIATTLAPLNELLKGKPKLLTWNSDADAAFNNSKQALANATLLTFPAPNAELQLVTDASDVAVGAVLEQRINGQPAPLAFYSKKLSNTERRYSTFDRELLAVYLATKHFKHLLEGQQFQILTDHLPLVHAFSKKTDPHSSRQQRQLSSISEFNCTLQHITGTNNSVADALSRNSAAMVHLGLDLQQLQQLQQAEDNEERNSTSLTWSNINIGNDNCSILCDTSTGNPRPWIPKPLRRAAFDAVHNLSHPSRRSTTKLMTERFVWKGIAKDSKSWAKACIACQRAKVHWHTESGIGEFDQPRRRFGHIHVDIVGPLPASKQHRYLFTIIDRSTRWPEAVPIKSADTESCIEALLNNWISRFGVPDQITSDRGTPFTSNLWTGLSQRLGIESNKTTAYNPEANGIVERLHRTLKAALMAKCNTNDWTTNLPWILLGLRTTPKEGTNVTAAEMTYGDNIQVPGDFFTIPGKTNLQEIRREVIKYIPCQPTYKNNKKIYVPQDLSTCKHVFVRIDSQRTPLTPPYIGPYPVLQRKQKTFQVNVRSKPEWISIDRLKPAYTLPEDDIEPSACRFSRAGRPLRKQSLSQGGSIILR